MICIRLRVKLGVAYHWHLKSRCLFRGKVGQKGKEVLEFNLRLELGLHSYFLAFCPLLAFLGNCHPFQPLKMGITPDGHEYESIYSLQITYNSRFGDFLSFDGSKGKGCNLSYFFLHAITWCPSSCEEIDIIDVKSNVFELKFSTSKNLLTDLDEWHIKASSIRICQEKFNLFFEVRGIPHSGF